MWTWKVERRWVQAYRRCHEVHHLLDQRRKGVHESEVKESWQRGGRWAHNALEVDYAPAAFALWLGRNVEVRTQVFVDALQRGLQLGSAEDAGNDECGAPGRYRCDVQHADVFSLVPARGGGLGSMSFYFVSSG